MRSLKESLLDDDLVDSIDKNVKQEIKDFLKLYFTGHSHCKISRNPNSDGKYEVSSNGKIIQNESNNPQGRNLTNGKFIWTVVNGDFKCNSKVVSLEGGPRKVTGDFNVVDSNQLTDLKGAPEEVGDTFYCSYNYGLVSLEGCPKKIDGNFMCNSCIRLTSLEGAPEEVGGAFSCCNCNITSLKGCPKKVGNRLNLSGCKQLTSLKYAPKEICEIYISDCSSLKSLKDAPKLKIIDNFDNPLYNIHFRNTKFSKEDIKKAFKIK